MPNTSENQPILTITTSKKWVLPPRPKKSKSSLWKKSVKQRSATAQAVALAAGKPGESAEVMEKLSLIQSPLPLSSHSNCADHNIISALDSPEQLANSITLINNENDQLKTKLLLLIHDYKSLKSLVTSPAMSSGTPVDLLFDATTTARKRVYRELDGPMNNLIADMGGLSHASPDSVVSPIDQETDEAGFELELFSFINLEQDSLRSTRESPELELQDEEEEDEVDSTVLSRLLSSTSDSDEHSLMTTFTKSTVVSTTTSTIERKPFAQQFRFYELPEFSEEDYAFLFEKPVSPDEMLAVIEEDRYNQVADFLEEKLMGNDIQYYEEKHSNS